MPSTVYLRRTDRNDPLPTVRELLDRAAWQDLVPPGSSVVIKPNLCTERPEMIHCANTSLSVLRAVCRVIRERTANVTIVESDGRGIRPRRRSRTTASTRWPPNLVARC